MEPKRELNATLVDLLDRVLEKGLVLHADIIISMAGIPLIGVTLKAALAGMETMLKYGMMEDWDAAQRAIASEEFRKKLISILKPGEKIILKTFGSLWYEQGIYKTWRPGDFVITKKRIILHRKEPAEMLFETNFEQIKGLAVQKQKHFKMEREELYIKLDSGEVVRLYLREDVNKIKNIIEEEIKARGFVLEKLEVSYVNPTPGFLLESEKIVRSGKMWYREPSSGILADTWKPGYLYFTDRNLYWYNTFDQKVVFQAPVDGIKKIALEPGNAYGAGDQQVLIINITKGEKACLSQDDDVLQKWKNVLDDHLVEGIKA